MRTPTRILEIALSIAILALASLPFMAEAHSEGFTANKGQVHDQFGRPNQAVLYLSTGPGMNVQLRKNGFSYDTYSAREGASTIELDRTRSTDLLVGLGTDSSPITYDFHRIDIHFVNGDPQAAIVQEGERADYTNYYTDLTGDDGATFVRSYSTVIYRDVWPHIDVRFNSGEDGFKYDVIVRPGGDLNDARFQVEGAAVSESLKGRLVLDWGSGSLEELIPDSWMELGRRKERVNAHYRMMGNDQFGFVVDRPINGTLVIDPSPSLTWATYYGGSSSESLGGASMDAAGNGYVGGLTESTNSIATIGAHDATYNGSWDGMLVKFSPTGIRLWGTYFGGTSIDYPSHVSANGMGTLVVCGVTWSTSGIATSGAHQTQLGDAIDGFLMLFNTDGTRQWGTYYGGSSSDVAYSTSLSISGRVALVGETRSPNGIATAGAPDVSLGGGKDGFVAWFSATGSRLFGSYLGGVNDDVVYSVEAGFANSEFVVTGSTSSSSGIATSGVFDATYNGGGDAFIALYNGSGSGTKTWCSYFGGPASDRGLGITYTDLGKFVICGTTESTTGVATTGSDQPSYGGGSHDGFHARFDRFTKARLNASYAGGNGTDHILGVSKLGNQGYALAGQFGSAGLATAGSFGPVGPGAYVAGYTSSGAKDWAGYFPGTTFHTDGIGSNSTGLLVAGTGTVSATPGAHQEISGGMTDLVVHRLINTAPSSLLPLQQPTKFAHKDLRANAIQEGVFVSTVSDSDLLIGSTIMVTDILGRRVNGTRSEMKADGILINADGAHGIHLIHILFADGQRECLRVMLP
ncbi:MAG: hypothetical protein MUE88_05275 [Flavobacteriales bacterium]|jgi:hypothetical protein|nr:hypothetical protein [Flavobacteriales bacterium]